MFDAIGSQERTRPWTVATSFAGQLAMVGLAIVIPLLNTAGLPQKLGWVTVPEPPPSRPHRSAANAAAHTKTVPSQMYRRMLIEPSAIPDRVVRIADPDQLPVAYDTAGVAGGIGEAEGSGRSVIDRLLSTVPTAVAPPAPMVIRKEQMQAIKRIPVGGKVQQAKLVSGPPPIYPPLARQARISGMVRLQAIISRDGTIIDLHAVSGHPLLIPAAIAAVARWVFQPTYLNGDPVEVSTEIDVNFTLQ